MQVQIAVFGKNKEIVDTLKRVINKNDDWMAFCACTQENLKQIVSENSINIVLYSSGIGEQELENTENWLKSFFPTIIQIQHFGGGSGLLQCEINSALAGIKPICKPLFNEIS